MTQQRLYLVGVCAEPFSVAPNLLARIRIEELTGAVVHALALRCQVRIEPQSRGYTGAEAAGLLDLFGGRERWADTLRPFTWLHATALAQGFTGSTDLDLVLPCSYDVEVAGHKYLQALSDGELPLGLLFSGTVFTRGSSGFGVEQVPWHHEATYRLPVQVWRDLMDDHFPGQAWLRVDRATLAALTRYRSARMHTGWDETLAELLAGVPVAEVGP